MSRRALAAKLGHPDTSAGIPEARWMRAMTFEALVRHERFVFELLTTAVGRLRLARPEAVRRASGRVSVEATATALQQAHLKAVHEEVATMVTSLAVPFAGMESVAGATPVKPDFAIVAPRYVLGDDGTEVEGHGTPTGSWLIMGDAKDYERVRSRIDDQRMLKGFLQVALGAASAQAWSKVPSGMAVHSWGALAVPRNAFLQPEAIVDCLDDHRTEVMDRVRERQEVLDARGDHVVAEAKLPGWVAHLEAVYDPATCPSCAMFAHCRSEVRASEDPVARLVELGVPPAQRPGLIGLVDGTGAVAPSAPASSVASLTATVSGLPQPTRQRRTDPVGLPGTVNVVIAKSDAAALGIHGISLRDGEGGGRPWSTTVFEDPQAPATRLEVMSQIGHALDAALDAVAPSGEPIHLVMPDTVTADVLVSIADSLAGVEISRLRWERDVQEGRTPLTFGGEPATVPAALTLHQRLAVSFLLEADRSRAVTLRSALVDVRRVLAAHVVPGGPGPDALRLDYLVRWAEATVPLDHRVVSDDVADSEHTPGARLSNRRSDAIHAVSRRGQKERSDDDPAAYHALVREELAFKAAVLDRAAAILETLEVSRLRVVHRALEADAQAVWLRRWELHASDLVRFGRVPWWWRNDQVDQLDKDSALATQLAALGNPQAARDMATTAGTRQVALATITQQVPLRVRVHSRRIKDGSTIHMAHGPLGASVELETTTLKVQKGSFKFGQQWVGTLSADDQTEVDGSLLWAVTLPSLFPVGSEIVVLDGEWVSGTFRSGHEIAVARPSLDQTSSPREACADGDYALDPASHQWCCRPHEEAEAEFSDDLAARRANGELNPQAWPPVIDEDHFDTVASGSPTETDAADESVPARPPGLTIDDLD
ncbi:hypothetical protein ATL31_0527 [Phycicoccus duodecadis]|uniref:Uncharacterized protein n=2 Tax=Phycicoccus duodecadis TaxID=173053 RepID=A0A2N3YFV6_9MICO|nr:hypothetical protein ATL31_0527 [Phycicoccus duodecadis]